MLTRKKACFSIIILIWFAATVWPAEPNLVGVWRFVKEIDRHADGSVMEVVPPDAYTGQVIYTEDGYMSAQIFPTGRTWKPDTATLKDLKRTMDLSTSYFGRYEVDASTSQVTHKVMGNLDPTSETENYKRHFILSGDQLVLSGTWEYGGEKLNFEITWTRAK